MDKLDEKIRKVLNEVADRIEASDEIRKKIAEDIDKAECVGKTMK